MIELDGELQTWRNIVWGEEPPKQSIDGAKVAELQAQADSLKRPRMTDTERIAHRIKCRKLEELYSLPKQYGDCRIARTLHDPATCLFLLSVDVLIPLSLFIYVYRRLGVSEVGGLVQPGSRFVSFVRARAAVCKVRIDLKNDSVAFPFPVSPREGFLPFSFPHLPPILLPKLSLSCRYMLYHIIMYGLMWGTGAYSGHCWE